MNQQQLTPSGIVILIAAAVMLIGSFFSFWELNAGLEELSFNAWSTDLFFPVTIIPVACGIEMAAHVALTSFTKVSLPARVLGFTWNQMHLVAGLQAAVMMLAFLAQEQFFFSRGTGFYLMLLSGIGLAIGAILRNNETPAT